MLKLVSVSIEILTTMAVKDVVRWILIQGYLL